MVVIIGLDCFGVTYINSGGGCNRSNRLYRTRLVVVKVKKDI